MKINGLLKKFILFATVTGSISSITLNAKAQQNLDDDDIISVEGVYSAQPAVNETKPVKSDEEMPAQLKQNAQGVDVRNLSDINKLAPFSEVSVIQKKFMPKTQRFQLFAGGSVMTNTPWYNNVGAKVNLSYNFTETFGLELNTMFLTNSQRESTKEIREEHGLKAEQFVYTKRYTGLDLVWSPVYGKISNLNNSIVPFEMYFALGAGSSNTNAKEGDVPTFHFGLGQIFAITKSMAFRWDYSFNTFSGTPTNTDATATPAGKSNYNDLVLSAGVSFFFPEASYR